MDKTVKALIIVVIILVAILGVAGGFILQGYMSNSNKTDVVNQTNSSINNIPNQTTSSQTTQQNSQSDQSTMLSAAQAETIANKYAAGFGEESSGDTALFNGVGDYNGANGDPYYHVELQWITPHNSGNSDDILPASYVEIDAKTGAINPRG